MKPEKSSEDSELLLSIKFFDDILTELAGDEMERFLCCSTCISVDKERYFFDIGPGFVPLNSLERCKSFQSVNTGGRFKPCPLDEKHRSLMAHHTAIQRKKKERKELQKKGSAAALNKKVASQMISPVASEERKRRKDERKVEKKQREEDGEEEHMEEEEEEEDKQDEQEEKEVEEEEEEEEQEELARLRKEVGDLYEQMRIAIDKKGHDVMRDIIEKPSYNINRVGGQDKRTALHTGVQCRDIEALDILLEHANVDCNIRNLDGMSP